MSQPHQHGPQCQHGHGHGGQGGHGHSHGHGGHRAHADNSIPPKEYF